MKTALKQELASDHFRRSDPAGHSFSRVFSQFELYRLVRFALDDRHAFSHPAISDKVIDLERDQVATAQLAVDCDVEQSQIAKVSREFESGADGPDLLGKQRALLPDEATFVPGSAFRCNGGKLDSRYDLPSIQPSNPNINIALTTYYSRKTCVGFVVAAPPSVSAQAKGGCEPKITDAAASSKVGYASWFLKTDFAKSRNFVSLCGL